jgi:hypothetical protein
MIMDEPSPMIAILPLLRAPVYPDLFLTGPSFEERTRGEEKPGSERGWQMEARLKKFRSSS